MKEKKFLRMDWKSYVSSVKVSFTVLLFFNLLYITLGFSTAVFFIQGISALFSVVGFVAFFVPLVAYSYVTWSIIHKHDGTAVDSAIASVLLSLLVFAASELVGFLATSIIFLSVASENIISVALRAHFAEQYLSLGNVLLGLVFGLVLAFLGGFFGFISSEIQAKFAARAKALLLAKESSQNRTKTAKVLEKDVKLFALSSVRDSLKKLGAALRQLAHL